MNILQNAEQNLLSLDTIAHCADTIQNHYHSFLLVLTSGNVAEMSATAATSFALIVAAEMGDKSQLVCMTLASKHRALPIILGAITAFAFLNSLAVIFGVAIASWLPDYVVAAAVTVLFAGFGIHSLRVVEDDEDEEIKEKTGHGIFFTTFLLITLAEFGDKTQLAVVGLSSAAAPAAVWLGSTLALASTSAVGILAGRTVLQKIPLVWLHKISGIIFLALSSFTAYRAYCSYAAKVGWSCSFA
ncbi:MAG: TMEM165/GDT1 family protein [Methylococcaceae bacterium]|nr:TMEM165/GDT1 family protein [Methylococcaceae bacterium]